ncbi:hypothetical protein EVAR_39012_1 [Eumeta japonica]|uniref:Uncharacterized protein n=1 Tax=Eumeta variegata TaxID=151549 RepID=A0A4C1WRB5_EUMVA|nr:hypothetical protein EVAR_39012_1 [Eumeta japonica]
MRVTVDLAGCGWESLMKSVTLGNVTMSHRTRERPPNALRLSHSTMIGLRARSTRELQAYKCIANIARLISQFWIPYYKLSVIHVKQKENEMLTSEPLKKPPENQLPHRINTNNILSRAQFRNPITKRHKARVVCRTGAVGVQAHVGRSATLCAQFCAFV